MMNVRFGALLVAATVAGCSSRADQIEKLTHIDSGLVAAAVAACGEKDCKFTYGDKKWEVYHARPAEKWRLPVFASTYRPMDEAPDVTFQPNGFWSGDMTGCCGTA